MLLRSNALVDLDEADRERLAEIGIRTAVDLREPGERGAEPSDLAAAGVQLHEVAVVDGSVGEIGIDLLAFNEWMLRERGDRLVEVIRLLSARDALPGVYFCSTGKDRTGMISALILSALGVDDND